MDEVKEQARNLEVLLDQIKKVKQALAEAADAEKEFTLTGRLQRLQDEYRRALQTLNELVQAQKQAAAGASLPVSGGKPATIPFQPETKAPPGGRLEPAPKSSPVPFDDDEARSRARRKREQAEHDDALDRSRARKAGGLGAAAAGVGQGSVADTLRGVLASVANGRAGTAVKAGLASFGGSKVGGALRGAARGAGKAVSAGAGAAAGTVGVITDVVKQLANLPSTLTQAFAPVNQLVEAFDPGLVQLFNQAIRDLTASLGRIFQPITEAGVKVADVFNSLFTELGPVFTPIVRQVAGVLQQLAPIVANSLKPPLEALAPVIGQVVGALGPVLTDLAPLMAEQARNLADVITLFGELAKVVLPPVVTVVREFARALTDTLAWIRDALRRIGIGSGSARNRPTAPVDLSQRTFAAGPAQVIGIEQLGEQARTAAFGARTVAERQLEEQERGRQLLEQIRDNTANQGGGPGSVTENPLGVALDTVTAGPLRRSVANALGFGGA